MNRSYDHSRSAGSRRQEQRRSRSRSRSRSPSSSSDNESRRHRSQQRRQDDSDNDDEVVAPKLAFGFKGKLAEPRSQKATATQSRFRMPTAKILPVQMKLATKTDTTKKLSVASAFSNNDSDDEIEEMPAECRMRMRNIGRDTPTSSGPNSFGKTKQGFCDAKKMFEKNLNEPSANKD